MNLLKRDFCLYLMEVNDLSKSNYQQNKTIEKVIHIICISQLQKYFEIANIPVKHTRTFINHSDIDSYNIKMSILISHNCVIFFYIYVIFLNHENILSIYNKPFVMNTNMRNFRINKNLSDE